MLLSIEWREIIKGFELAVVKKDDGLYYSLLKDPFEEDMKEFISPSLTPKEAKNICLSMAMERCQIWQNEFRNKRE